LKTLEGALSTLTKLFNPFGIGRFSKILVEHKIHLNFLSEGFSQHSLHMNQQFTKLSP